ncbi:uncharacterized protein LOC135170270 [Diachasmimorpha longicaudata]|uniref:uncharacterized protein LOC135170270 n=1 Tax=Diachasmimorpha longicaudata TaxID=58733 RepID=UPI0030B89231
MVYHITRRALDHKTRKDCDPNDLAGPSGLSEGNTAPPQDDFDWINNFDLELFGDFAIENHFDRDLFENFNSELFDIQCSGGENVMRDRKALENVEEFNLDVLDQQKDQQNGCKEEIENLSPALRTTRRSRQRLPRFKLDTHVMEFAINPLPEGRDPAERVEGAFRDVYNKIIEAGGRGMNRMCLTFNFANMQRGTAWVSPRAIKGYEFQDLRNLVSPIGKSANGFGCADTSPLKLHVAEAPVGQGFLENDMKKGVSRKCILHISNEDGLCLARSPVVAKAHAKKSKTKADKGKIDKVWQAIRECKGRMQREEAKRLTQMA